MKLRLNNQIKTFIDEVEKKSGRKITFSSSKKVSDSHLLARSHADLDNAIIYLDPSINYSETIGQFKIAHEVTHIHFHENLNFKDLDYTYPSTSVRRIFEHIASSIEDLFVFDYLKEKSIAGYDEIYTEDIIPLINIYKDGIPRLNRVEEEYQEIIKTAAYIYLSLVSKSSHRKKLKNAYLKYLGRDRTEKLNDLINQLRQIFNSTGFDNGEKCKKMTRLLLKKLGALDLLSVQPPTR